MRVAAAFLGLASVLCAQAEVGEKVPDFELGEVVQNGDGRTSLAEFRGSPVLVDFWGTR